jgi:hypothetical protein
MTNNLTGPYGFTLSPSAAFSWDPPRGCVGYVPAQLATVQGKYKLLHEIAHALLRHSPEDTRSRYSMERDAWNLARQLARHLELPPQERLIRRALKQTEAEGYPLTPDTL